jgi:GAF domain-containing protein
MANLAEKFKGILKADGLWAAMRWLNDRVPYRFTAIFAFQGDMLHNLCLVDKDNANITGCPDQAITDSYCIYIHRSGERFSIEDALSDGRVEGHPKRHSYHCYYGIPLVGLDGNLLGTVCHFNSAPIRVTEDVVAALDDLAPCIAEAAFSASGWANHAAHGCE